MWFYETYKNYKGLKDFKNGIFIECGALNGHAMSVSHSFEKSLNWECYNIEADPQNYLQLLINRPHSKLNLNIALHSKNEYISWYTGDLPKKRRYMSKTEAYIKELEDNLIIVPGMTYKTLIDNYLIHHVDIFVLDVERHEEEVIKGMRGARTYPEVFFIEIMDMTDDGVKRMSEYLTNCCGVCYIPHNTWKGNCAFVQADHIHLFEDCKTNI